MTSRWEVVGLVLVSGMLALCVSAAEPPRTRAGSDRVDELLIRYNLHPAFEKLGRGVANTLTGWMEIPLTIHHRYAPQDAAASFFTGIGLGLTKGLVRTVVGVYEAVTFFFPYPEHYAPILPTLEYFKRPDKQRKPLPLE